jgi:hypothetical protein
MVDHHQLADYTLNERSLPFDRLPRGYVHWAQPCGNWLEAGVDSEVVRFEHDDVNQLAPLSDIDVPGGSRFDFKPYVSLPLEGSSWFLKPKLAWRHTAYQLDGSPQERAYEYLSRYEPFFDPYTTDGQTQLLTSAGQARLQELITQFSDDKPTRSVPITSVDAGLYFDRETTIRGDRYLHTLEPRIYYLRVPYENQDGIPVFDTAPLTFSWGQLFRDNRFGGADRQADANQLTTALTTRLIGEDDGRERLSVSLGQIKYFDASRVVLPGEPLVQQGKSAWVAETTVAPSDRWNISAAYQWDPKYRGTNLASLRARYLIGDQGIVNIGYRFRRDPVTRSDLFKQADFSFLYPVNPNWSLVGRYYYSLLDHKPLEQVGGVQWESCCLAVRVLGRRYLRNRTGDLNNSLQVEFELKGLGSAGQDTRRILRRAILGYDRDDLYLVPPSSVDRTDSDLVPDPFHEEIPCVPLHGRGPVRRPAIAQQQSSTLQPLDRIAGIVDEDVILRSELDRAVANVTRQYAGRENQLPPHDVLERQVLERLVLMKLQLARAEQTGVRVTDQEVDSTIAGIARQNNLTIDQLRQQAAADGGTFDDFRNTIRDELVVQRMRQRFAQSRISVSEAKSRPRWRRRRAPASSTTSPTFWSDCRKAPRRTNQTAKSKIEAYRAWSTAARWISPQPQCATPTAPTRWKAAIWAGVRWTRFLPRSPRWSRT